MQKHVKITCEICGTHEIHVFFLSSFKTRLLCPHLWVPEKWAFIIQSFCHPPSTIKEGNPTHPHKRTAIHHLKAIIRGKQLGDTTVIEQRNVVGHIHLNSGFRPQKTDVNPHPTFAKKQAFFAVYLRTF